MTIEGQIVKATIRRQEFGTTGKEVPVIGQGTWKFPERGKAVDEAKKTLHEGIERGMVHIDTAEMYGSGRAEEIVGEAIQGLSRARLFIVSKVLPSNASYKGTMRALDASLKRLNTDYLDCYLLHWPGSYPLEETIKAFEEAVDSGKILSFGVSNFDVEDMEEAETCLTRHKIACNQVLYNLGERGIERSLIPYCQSRSIAVVGYTPFGTVPQEGTRNHAALKEIADKHGATIRQVVLAFLVRDKGLFTIPKASNADHMIENAGASTVELDKKDIQTIDSIYPAPDRDVPLSVL